MVYLEALGGTNIELVREMFVKVLVEEGVEALGRPDGLAEVKIEVVGLLTTLENTSVLVEVDAKK